MGVADREEEFAGFEPLFSGCFGLRLAQALPLTRRTKGRNRGAQAAQPTDVSYGDDPVIHIQRNSTLGR